MDDFLKVLDEKYALKSDVDIIKRVFWIVLSVIITSITAALLSLIFVP